MRKKQAVLIAAELCAVPPIVLAIRAVAAEHERAERDRRHRVRAEHYTESARRLHGQLNGWDHWQVGVLHEFDGYYADAIASYEEAERLGFGPLTGLKDNSRRALGGDTAAVDAKRERMKESGRRMSELLFKVTLKDPEESP